MIELDTTKFKTPPFAHQVEGIKALLRYPAFALYDEMGAGKSKQVVDAACTLHANDEINLVLIVCPAAVRSVWSDAVTGQIKVHGWVQSVVQEFHSLHRGSNWRWVWRDEGQDALNLNWVVTNYEFLRSDTNLVALTDVLRAFKVMLVLDESSYLKSRTAQQTKAIKEVRAHCTRCVLLNGTPVTDSPLDLWAQLEILDKTILGKRYKNFYHFKNTHAIYGGWKMKQVVKWKDIDQLSELVKPRVLRRLKKNCLDLPPKLYTQREVALTTESWKRYKELKQDALVHLTESDVQLEPNSAVRIMRLAQLTSGHLGSSMGITRLDDDILSDSTTQDLSDEKLRWCAAYVSECTSNAIIVWTRWRRERERLVELLRENDTMNVYQLYGGQPVNDRRLAVESFTVLGGNRRVLVAQPHAGGHGLNLVAADHVVYLSNDFSLGIRLQSEDRCHRPGQRSAVTYVDVLATGPQGQKTVDHAILKALRDKEEVARWTTARWRRELGDE